MRSLLAAGAPDQRGRAPADRPVLSNGRASQTHVRARRRPRRERPRTTNPERVALGQEFGATDVVRERGEEAVERVGDLTGGLGVHSALECVGVEQAVVTVLEIARPGGAIGRVGVPEHETAPTRIAFWKSASIAGGPAPVRAYIDELLPDAGSSRAASSTAQERSTRYPPGTAR